MDSVGSGRCVNLLLMTLMGWLSVASIFQTVAILCVLRIALGLKWRVEWLEEHVSIPPR